MQSFDDVLFTMMSFSAKKSGKKILLGKEIKSLKWPQKFHNYVLQWYQTGDQENCIFFWNLYINAKLRRTKEKNDISLNISKKFATIFDHWLDLVKPHNKNFFRQFLGFAFFSRRSKLNFCDFLAQNNVIAKVTSSKLCFLAQYIFFFWQIMILIYQKHI